jgi:hypothetical protein
LAREIPFRAGILTCLLAICQPIFAQPQPQEPVAEPVPSDLSLPGLRHLAAALSDPSSRADTLMSMAVLAHVLESSPAYFALEDGELEAGFSDDRAWLDRLAARFTRLPVRSAVLDASAWMITLELDQHQLAPPPLISPLGTKTADLMRRVFDRGDESLAAASLPDLLMRMEFLAPRIWQGVLGRTAEDPELLKHLASLNEKWFDPWMAAEPPAPAGGELAESRVEWAIGELGVLAASLMNEGAQDSLRLKRLRFALLEALPGLEPGPARDAAYLLRLVSALDGLQDGAYLALTETLLWVVSDILLESQRPFRRKPVSYSSEPFGPRRMPNRNAADDGAGAVEAAGQADAEVAATAEAIAEPAQPETPHAATSGLARVLANLLPQLSSAFARDFNTVDPRINTNLAAAFDVAQSLQDSLPEDLARQSVLLRELADAVARLVLQIPDINYYVDQPVRREISEEINLCISMAAAAREGQSQLSREQFDRCIASMVEMSNLNVRSAELAGDPDGPYGMFQLQRELELAPWQRINYLLGYLHELAPGRCELPSRPLVNALEWSALATALTWFARQSPVYFQTPENEALVLTMKQQGSELLQTMKRQVACFSGVGPGISDPVSMSLNVYREALDELIGGIRQAELTFREANLAPGADIVLHGGPGQRTAYRPEGLMIAPCNPDNVCEMTGKLEATRALIGLFPDTYLIADQTGMGKVEICYDNVQWVQRRTELVRPDDPNVANFFGRLSFDLIGRFREGGTTREVFGSNFVSPEDYHYLFAANNEEVLDDGCPTEWVGSKTVTPLYNDSRVRVVPDRLTYLAGARQLPSQVLSLNWSRGAEWRDWFVTGLGITRFEFEADETIDDRLERHLEALYKGEQSVLYRALLRLPSRGGVDDPTSLYEETSAVSTAKALVRSQLSLFYPDYLIDSDQARSFLQGSQSLIDESVLRRFRDSDIAIESINETGISRLDAFQSFWDRQPASVRDDGSASLSVANAIGRLNALYREFFEDEESRGDRSALRSFGG